MTRLLGLLVWFCVCAPVALAAEGTWKDFTSKREVRDIAPGPSLLWVATSGGAFAYTPSNDSYRQLTTADGLQTNDLTAVTVDGSGNVWFGSSDGGLQRYAPLTGAWTSIGDIAQISQPQKQINALRTYGDSLFILGDNGLGLFSISRSEFLATYAAYGSGAAQVSGNVLDMTYFQGALWVATRFGVATTSVGNPNPAVPESWQVYNHTNGLPSDLVTSFGTLHDTLFAGTSSGLAYFDGTQWHAVIPTAGLSVLGMVLTPLTATQDARQPSDFLHGALLVMTPSSLLNCASAGDVSVASSSFASALTRIVQSSTVVLGTQGSGIALPSDTTWTYHIPPGPPTNNLVGIAVDAQGTVWAGTGANGGIGFVSYDGTSWRLYSTDTDPQLGTNDFYKMAIGASDAKWALNWGNGATLIDDAGRVRRVFTAANGLQPAVDPAFVVVGGVAVGADGVTWIAERTPPGDTSLALLNSDTSLAYVVGCGPGCSMRNPYNVFTDVVIDQNGTKWFANFGASEPFVANRATGFYWYNDHYSLPGSSAGWGKLTTSDGLPSSQVWSVAVDHDNALWVGTDEGLSIIFDPSDPHAHVATYYPPPQNKVIQGIVVDPLNNKWIATKEGVFVLSSDGTSILQHYTVANTGGKLLDDDVNSIAIDARSGVVYFGTEKGLCALTTSAIAPLAAYQELAFAPNPFYVPASAPLTIDGLTQNSTIKILRVDGVLVREMPTPGGRVAYWDGRDKSGRLVGTGIYVIIAFGEDGATVGKGKLAVIRR